MTALLLLFSKWNDGKNFGWHLVFSIMFLVGYPMKRTLISKWKKSNKKYRIIFVLLKHLSSQTKILPQSLIFSMVNAMATAVFAIQYGNTGCGVFKGGIQIWKCFWLTINCSQMKLLNFANWCNGGVLKSAKIWLSYSIF